jgi:hypothetical protein
VLREHLETFLAERDLLERPLPKYVVATLRGLLGCGDLARGLARFRCACGTERLVAFSCKDRAVCGSCMSRRQTRISAKLVDEIFPDVRVRQWVLSLPFFLRYRVAFDHALLLAVHRVMAGVVRGFYAERGRALGLPGGRTGAVTAVQRFGSSCELNPHFHMIGIDGLYVPNRDGGLSFRGVAAPTTEEVEALCEKVSAGVKRELVARGVWEDDDEGGQPADDLDPPVMADVFAASVQGRSAAGERAGRSLRREKGASPRPVVEATKGRVGGFDLHAGVVIGRKRRDRREQLFRYVLRPPLAADRLALTAEGDVLLKLKRPWRDGTTALRLTPVELIARLAALVCKPYTNQVIYTGVLAPNAGWRSMIVPGPRPPQVHGQVDDPVHAESAAAPGTPTPSRARRSNPNWATLMKRGLDLDVLACPTCGGRFRFVACIMSRDALRRILRHLGLRPEPFEAVPARPLAPAPLEDEWP